MKDVKFKTGEWSSIVNGVSELKDVDIITLVQKLGTITNDAKDACDRYDVDNAIDIESMDGVLMDDLDERIAKLAQKTFKIQDTLPADIDQPFYDSMDSLIEKLSNMNIMGYETMARGSFSNGVNSAGVAMPKMKVTLEDLLGSSSPLTDYLRVEYDKMKQEIGDVSFEDYQRMAFADTSFDYYSRNEKVKDLAVTVVINGAVLVIGGMLPWQLMVALGLTSGAKNVSDAWRGKDLFTGKELSTGDRILRGLSGIADLALAGYGTYKGLKPLKGTNKVVVSDRVSGPRCFVSGTLILTEHGHKPIEFIQIDEKVLARHENSNVQSYEKVVQLFVSETNKLVRITIGSEMIETTEEHPFYLPSKGWIKAKELTCNDDLIDSVGNSLSITDIQIINLNKPTKVYNFEVENAHTYFVSNLSILVHNICDDALNKWHKGTFDSVEDSLEYHFKTHGAEVGATSIEQYIEKADQFTKNLRRARTKMVNDPTPGVKGYYKNGKYVFIAPDGTIVSFGKQ